MTINRLKIITGRKEVNLKGYRDNYAAQTSKSIAHLNSNWKDLTNLEVEKNNNLGEKAFEKFAKWYNHLKVNKEKVKLKKIGVKEKFNKKDEKLEILEHKRVESTDAIMKNLRYREKRRKEQEASNTVKNQEKIEKFKETCKITWDNRRSIDITRDEKNNDAIAKQVQLINNAGVKDLTTNTNKSTIYEKSILDQIEMEKKISSFYRKLDDIKQRSIAKLSPQKQKRHYLDIKLEKEEKLRKIEEDKKAAAGGS